LKIVNTIGAGIGVVLSFAFLGCGSIPIVAAGVPAIQQVAPAPLLAGANGATLTVLGANFDSGSKVLWNGTELSTTVVDSNTLSSPVESANLATPGVVDLAVKNTISGRVSPSVKVSVNSGNSSSSISITTASLPDATVNSPYSDTFAASGGSYPYTWSLGSGSKLPAGLSLDASTGTLAGTPTAAGTYSFGVVATDATRTHSKSTSYTLVVHPVTLSISSSVPASAKVGSAYSLTLSATGGTTSYRWSVSSGSLPAGLSLSPAKGTISGTPTTAGLSNFVISVQDSSSPAQTASQPFSIAVAGASVTPLGISTSSIPSATTGQSYSAALSATGGAAPYTWSLTSGSLPSGISLTSAGVLSGTTSSTGTFPFVATVSDTTSQTAPVSLTLVVSATPLKVTTTSLPSAISGAAYSQTLQANGGTPGYKWSIASGSLPPGLTLNQTTGAISGTPTSASVASFTAMAADSSNPTLTATTSLSISVASAALAIAPPSLPSLTVGSPYSQQLHATGGSSPYTWSLASGSLPPGLVLSSNGVISGSVSSASSSYTYTFSVRATDSSSLVQTATASASIALLASAPPLSISSSTLPTGTTGANYSSSLVATGGTPGYTWTIKSGSLPAGLTLAGTTGVISGIPGTSGVSTFTAAVTDNGNPAQTQSVTTSITIANSTAVQSAGTTWYIRPDGGTRYSANMTNGQCDGKSDVPYPGSGVNQHCAFRDFRYMWDDRSGRVGQGTWVMAGGDTVLIRGCSSTGTQAYASDPNCRLGWDGPTGDLSNDWCYGVGSYTCYNPPIPAGTATQHTRILGQNFAACNANGATNPKKYSTNLTQLFGGFSLTFTFNLQDTQYVDIQCIELTTHNGVCTRGGYPATPRGCNSNQPVDDYAQNGFIMDNKTANISLQDVYVHGFNSSGFFGPIGGGIQMTRVYSGFNAFSGWNFDDGSDTPDAPGSSITARYVTMEGNGCYEEYPIVHTGFPARACYDSVSNGFGDGWSGQDTVLDSFICDHCALLYNTKDGFIGPHTQISNLSITNSYSYGNMGSAWKWGATLNSTVLFQNNLTVGNCRRMEESIPGAAQNFSTATGIVGSYLSNFCRAGGATFAYITRQGSNNIFIGNTIINSSEIIFQENCGYYAPGNMFVGETNCGTVPNLYRYNNFLGYHDPQIINPPALYYAETPSVHFTGSYNNEYGLKSGTSDACGVNNVTCVDPLLASEPILGDLTSESELDVFNAYLPGNSFYPSTASPLRGAAGTNSGLAIDYYGFTRPTPSSIGAVELP